MFSGLGGSQEGLIQARGLCNGGQQGVSYSRFHGGLEDFDKMGKNRDPPLKTEGTLS